ncbi:ATP-binding protein [Streptomyces longisporoflavus]|uniref:ATP-binding protein n=1 Tax=Streptomyces longisporoflavus TaxID=28044 RepID=A0ABW7R604_9ACTN
MTATEPHANSTPDTYTAQLPCTPESVRRARALISSALEAWGVEHVLGDAGRVIVSELMTNVVHHTKTDLAWVAIRRGDHQVHIEVADSSHHTPRTTIANKSAECGRGLLLIDELSSLWGYEKHPWGKVIWVVLRAREVSKW